MLVPAVGAAVVLFAQLSAAPPAAGPTPTLADPPISQITIAGQLPEPTLAPPPSGADPRYGDASAAVAATSMPPADAAAALAEPIAPLAAPKPGELMRSLVATAPSAHLTGTATKLSDVLETARSRREQTERTAAYWELSAAMTELALAEREANELAALRDGAAAAAGAWDARERELDVRTRLASLAVVAAQLRLQALLGVPAAAADALPLAVDVPHCGRYETKYAEIFAGRRNPAAEQLSDMLALRHEQLESETASVAEAVDALRRAQQQASAIPAAASDVVLAYDLVSLRTRQFVATARDYNQEIAAYAELAAPGNVGTERLVGMLIRTSATGELQGEAPRRDSQVAPAAFDAENRPPAPTLGQPPEALPPEVQPRGRNRLFGGDRTEVRRPLLDRLLHREHSILRRQR